MSKHWLEWFDWKNENECEWALGYLAKAGEPLEPYGGAASSRLNLLIKKWPPRPRDPSLGPHPIHSHYRALETRMRAAYYNKRRRAAQKDHKTYSLIMKKSAQKLLTRLSAHWGLKQNQVVEHLIFSGGDLKREFDDHSKREIRRAQEECKKQKEKLQDRLKEQQEQIKVLKREIRDLKSALLERKVTKVQKRLRSYDANKPNEE